MISLLKDIRLLLIFICFITILEKGAEIWDICYKIWSDNQIEKICAPKDTKGTFL